MSSINWYVMDLDLGGEQIGRNGVVCMHVVTDSRGRDIHPFDNTTLRLAPTILKAFVMLHIVDANILIQRPCRHFSSNAYSFV